jgi:glycosyltransferase involved in cell wall biosynthesis
MAIVSELPAVAPDKTGWPWTEESPQSPETMPDGSPWPRISIVTPSLNQGQFIEETIRSVLLQGYPNLEYLIIDGGSTDGSVEIIKKYAPWLTYWVSEPDRGQSHAINKGWERATGDIFAWINSDDYYASGTFSRIARTLATTGAGPGFVHGKSIVINSMGLRVGQRGSDLDLCLAVRTSSHPISQSSVFYRGDVLRRVGFVDEDLRMSMDWDLFLRIAQKHETRFLHYALSYMRETPLTKTATVRTGFGPDRVRILDKLYASEDCPQDLLRVKSTAYCTAYVRAVGGYIKAGNSALARLCFLMALRYDPVVCLSRARTYIPYLLFPRKYAWGAS